MPDEGFVGVQVAAKDVHTEVELSLDGGRAYKGNEAVPVTNTSVELVPVPREAMFW